MTVLFLSRAMEEVKSRYLQRHSGSDVDNADFLDVDFVHLTESVNARLKVEKDKALKSGELPVKCLNGGKNLLQELPLTIPKKLHLLDIFYYFLKFCGAIYFL